VPLLFFETGDALGTVISAMTQLIKRSLCFPKQTVTRQNVIQIKVVTASPQTVLHPIGLLTDDTNVEHGRLLLQVFSSTSPKCRTKP
jgi:hypothetical protein